MTRLYKVAGVLAVLGQLSDCVTTQIGLSMGAEEANPLMVGVVKYALLQYSFKLGMAVLALCVCQKLLAPWKWGILPILIIGFTGFGAAIWNLWILGFL
jgi:hypothetical protein